MRRLMSRCTSRCRWLMAIPVVLALLVATAELNAQTTTCVTVYAQNVVSSNVGSNQDPGGTDVNNILGNDSTTYWSPGNGGNIVLNFGADYGNSGDSTADICVREKSDNDCYYVCFFPADTATANAISAAGMSQNNGWYEFNTTYCGDLDLDLDALVPGFAAGTLNFSKIMLIDDGDGSDGSEWKSVCALVCTTTPAPTPTPGVCTLVWASNVVSSSAGNNQQVDHADPNDALGNTPTTYWSTGLYGNIVLEFGQNVTTSGDSAIDVCVRDKGQNDCYYVCFFPADAATAAAFTAAGMSENNGWYEFPNDYCGNLDLDLDALVPGFNAGDLSISKIMIIDNCATNNGTELEQVCALICTPAPPTNGCEKVFAANVLSSNAGANQLTGNADPASALGDTPTTYYSLGKSGNLVLDFGQDYTTSGDSTPDVCVREWGDADCYYVCFYPADAATAAALSAAGMSQNNGWYEFPNTYCGDLDLDLDALVPGFNAGDLMFSKIMILDDGSSGNGAEIETVSALICLPPPPSTDCELIYATEVLDSIVGANPNSNGPNPSDVIGDTPDTYFALGDGGSIRVGFGQNFTTSGSGAIDICVDEFGVEDCYTIILEAGSGSTFLAMQDAGLTMVTPGQFALPGLYCGDPSIDLDAIIPGYGEGELLFSNILIVDDMSGGDGAEINRVCALICNSPESPLAELGDCVFVDADCDGIQDPGEVGKPHVTVVLVRASDGQVVDFMMTSFDGKYSFKNIVPGDYLVVFDYNEVAYAATLPNQGNDDELDSDFDEAVGFVPVTLAGGEVNNTIDFGVCVDCVGEPATITSMPAGWDPNFDPVLEITPLIPGEPISFKLTTAFPGELGWIYYSLGVVQPINYMGVNFYIDVLNTSTNLGIGIIAPTDENGQLCFTSPDSVPVGFDGFTVVFQGRVCASTTGPPGPFAPLPDFFSNGMIATIGCPP